MSRYIRSTSASDVPAREITDESLYLSRRDLLSGAATWTAAATLLPLAAPRVARAALEPGDLTALVAKRNPLYSTLEEPNDFDDATRYNNFYEFGTDKEDPARHAGSLRSSPWSVTIEGEVAKPGVVALEDLLAPHTLEERVYRLRCVEAWSMVIPWIGIPLGDVLKRFEPTSRAKFVAFRTLHDPVQMPGQRRSVLNWPYREGLRIDEAMHPLALLSVGMYGRVLPNQNGAPLRLVVPWKYGFKSIKSIVSIALVEKRPVTSWNESAPREYGFYSNVNPDVDHPRWSQKRERRIGEFRRRETLPYNGYADEVGSLYAGMDLRKNF
jgi:sulfoxide reductase catalytic subunit YedY